MASRRRNASSKKVTEATSETTSAKDAGSASALAGTSSPSSPSWGTPCLVFLPNVPLLQEHHFGYIGGPDANEAFSLQNRIPLCTFPDTARTDLLRFPRCSTLRVLITDLDMETPIGRDQFPKPVFIFGDGITISDSLVHPEDSKLLRRVGNRFLFLPNMKRMYPLSYFLNASCRRGLTFDVVKERENILLEPGRRTRIQIGGQLKGLKPGLFEKRTDLIQEAPLPANLFIRQFIAAQGEFPVQTFRSPGWVYSGDEGWWTRMVDFVLEDLKEPLSRSGLTIPVIATRRGVVQSQHNLFAMLERYNPDSCTFFTPVGELGFALHEMQAVSGLPFGRMPYEEFIPTTEALSLLRVAYPAVYATFWELMCHFYICAQVVGMRGGGIMHTAWAGYLFQNLNQKGEVVSRLAAISPKNAKARIKASNATYMTECMEDEFEAGVKFDSFHYQATVPITDTALLAGFFMIWLKRCVVPSKPVEAVLAEVVYPAVLLAHGHPVCLLTAMTGCLQNGLRMLTSELVGTQGVKSAGKKAEKTPPPRVPVPYTYLVAWFVLHCPTLMTGAFDNNDVCVPFIQRLESASWASAYIVRARQLLAHGDNYRILCCAPNFDGADEKDASFQDLLFEGSSSLEEGTFRWLLMIRLGYLVYRLKEKCIIEPYTPSRFARQFGYDQLYVGNPNPALARIGNLYEGARAWFFFSAGGTHARFTLPNSPPGCSTVADFCDWFDEASRIPEYDVYTSCVNKVRELYKSGSSSTRSRLPGIEDYLSCEQEAARAIEAPKELLAIEPSETGVHMRAEEELSIVDSSEDKAADKISIETPASKPRSSRSGKKALTAAEVGEYDRRIRKRKPVVAKDSKRAKLMGDAMKSAPIEVFEGRKEVMSPTAFPSPEVPVVEQKLAIGGPISNPSEELPSEGAQHPIRTDYANCFTYPPTAPPPSSKTLRKLIEQFEHWMQMTIDVVSVGEVGFNTFEPHLLTCLNQIAQQGNAWWNEQCRESMVILEYELQFLSMLRHDDLGPEVDQALSRIKASREQRQGSFQKSSSEKESHIPKEIAEPVLSEGELKEKAIREVKKTREANFAALKFKLKSWKLMGPAV